MKLPFILWILFTSFIGLSQEPHVYDWAKNLGGSLDETSYSITSDDSGNVIVTGCFDGVSDFDPGSDTSELSSNGDTDIFIAKYDQEGNYIWAVGIGGNSDDCGNDVTTDPSGNIYATGYFTGNVDFDPGPGTSNLNAGGDYNAFILKLNPAGDFIMAVELGGSGEDVGHSIEIDDQGNIYTTGHFDGTADFKPGGGSENLTSEGGYDGFVSKLDNNGDFIWAKRLGGDQDDISYSLDLDTSGNAYCTGYFRDTAYFDTLLLAATGSFESFVVKLDVNGNYIWARKLGGTGADFGRSIGVDNQFNVYSVGYFQGTGDFDPDSATANLTSGGINDIYISKLDSSGNYVWAYNFGSIHNDFAFSIDVSGDGNSYTTGYFRGVVDFDPGTAFNPLYAGGISEVYIMSLDAGGNYNWAYSMGGSGSDFGRGVHVDDSKNVYTTGHFQGVADFEAGPGITNLFSAGSFDAFIQKLRPCEDAVTINPTACYSYTSPSGNEVWDTSGTYIDTLINKYGCDSIITVNLTVDSSDLFTTVYDTTCTNYVSPDGSEIWDTSGTYTDTILNSYGCDSIITIYLTVDPTALTGEIFDTTCTTYLSPSGNHIWDSTGVYIDSVISVAGCDSLITVHLFVDTIPLTSTLNDTVCSSYLSPSGNYIWDSTGTYVDALTSAEGCDSLVTVNLVVDSNLITTSLINVTACTSYTSPSGISVWDSSGIYTDTIASIQGCDSVITIDLTIDTNAVFSNTIADTSCFSYVSPSGNYVWTTTNTYTDTLQTNQGCDSILTIDLVINTIDTSVIDSVHTLTAQVAGASYQWVNCDSNYLAIPGETNQSFTATENGNYAVIITENGCSDTSACFNIFSIGIEESNLLNKILVSPNPTSGRFIVDLGQNHENLTVRIVNIFGQIIYTEAITNEQRFELEIDGASGYYLLQVLGNQFETKQIKIVKQ